VNGELVETHREVVSDPSLAERHDPSLPSEEYRGNPTGTLLIVCGTQTVK